MYSVLSNKSIFFFIDFSRFCWLSASTRTPSAWCFVPGIIAKSTRSSISSGRPATSTLIICSVVNRVVAAAAIVSLFGLGYCCCCCCYIVSAAASAAALILLFVAAAVDSNLAATGC